MIEDRIENYSPFNRERERSNTIELQRPLLESSLALHTAEIYESINQSQITANFISRTNQNSNYNSRTSDNPLKNQRVETETGLSGADDREANPRLKGSMACMARQFYKHPPLINANPVAVSNPKTSIYQDTMRVASVTLKKHSLDHEQVDLSSKSLQYTFIGKSDSITL